MFGLWFVLALFVGFVSFFSLEFCTINTWMFKWAIVNWWKFTWILLIRSFILFFYSLHIVAVNMAETQMLCKQLQICALSKTPVPRKYLYYHCLWDQFTERKKNQLLCLINWFENNPQPNSVLNLNLGISWLSSYSFKIKCAILCINLWLFFP